MIAPTVSTDTYDPNSPEYIKNPGIQNLALKQKGRIVFYEPWQAFIITRYEDIMEFWKTEPLSSDFYDWEMAPARPDPKDWTNFERALIGHSIMNDADRHRMIRKIVAPAFSRNVVDEIERRIKPDIEKLFSELGQPDEFDFTDKIAMHIAYITICRLIGVPEKYWEDIKPCIENFTKAWNPILSDEVRQQARDDSNVAIDIFKEVIAERRNSQEENDFLSILLKVESENEDFGEWDILNLILALVGAGSDTTKLFQSWVAYALTKFPDQREAALSSAPAFANAFHEVERWACLNKMGFARYAPEDMEVMGQPIKKGQMVLLNPDLSAYDPDMYPEPEKFDVSRPNEPNIQFGYGPRFCIGAALAKSQMYLTMQELFKCFPNLELVEDAELNEDDMVAMSIRKLMLKTNI